ncbi:MAG: DUF5679 domain-containing protein [Desulfurococcales archaeon]|nr:DUF5679 domain-containing protein [Desulfurococcales archaeon]MEB3758458.1 DUF5679 domain-containing protein [Desulfurococcales archaeon]MEB3773128.1 DUF5679 domain-containing protein [Desulfurococcales archaeon]MEB3825149.1 DUF5679 domain-containing protein [Desulfurococcales archaeon]MEB3845744.1 DUF5679 domain-containing protein [Desulfurococcales archaeon]
MAKKKPEIEVFCVKCRKKMKTTNYEVVTLKNGRKAIKAVCPGDCGITYKFVSEKTLKQLGLA